MKIVFSKYYTVKTPGHVFRAGKFEAALNMLLKDGIVLKKDIVAPAAPSKADLLLAHSPAWVKKNLKFGFTPEDSVKAELTITRGVARAHMMNVGGTIKAARLALKNGVGINCGGGAHHAFKDHGEGFCLLNDIAIAVKKLLKERLIRRAMIIDLDAHQGNGTAAIFRGDKRVFTFSMHGVETYPEKRERSSLDIELKAGTGDAVYLAVLKRGLSRVLDEFRPDLAVYLAGADVYKGDALGGLGLTMLGIKKRDAFVFSECRGRGVPVALTLGGGYALKPENSAKIHAETIKSALSRHAGDL
ncbi:MAG TPA: histone deacetylase [Elusimicrobia bacterium]|nr:histone deacetylase [Elusimicrobiota bacterium]